MRPATVGELNCVMTEVFGRRRAMRIGVLGAACVSVLAVASFLWATQGGILASLGRELPLAAVVVAMAGLIQVSVAAWMVAHRHPLASIGLAILGAAVTLPWWSVWTALPDPVSAKLLALAPLAAAGTAQIALRWTAERPASPLLTWVYIMTAAAALALFVGYNPFDDPGCGWVCVDVPPPARDLISTRRSVLVTALITTVVAGIVVRTLIKARPRLASGLLGGAVMVSLGLLVGYWVIRWTNWGEQSGEALILPFVAQALVGGAVVIATLRSMGTRDAVTRTISRLNEAEMVLDDMESTLAGVQFALPEGNGWVDPAGLPVAGHPEDERFVTISDSSGPVLRLPVERGRDPVDVLDALTPAARLSLKNTQLSAITRARVAEVRASQARVVAASDTESRRIERDLHDGAQQRLVSAALYLSVARTRLDHELPVLDRAEASLLDALHELRRLAHGAFPDSLETEGLGTALKQLAADSNVPMVLDIEGIGPLPPDAARAIFATASATVLTVQELSPPAMVRMRATTDTDTFRFSVQIQHDSIDSLPDLSDVEDRIGALGGTATVSTTTEGALIVVVLPCV
jgi:signal transduction histidine kinase